MKPVNTDVVVCPFDIHLSILATSWTPVGSSQRSFLAYSFWLSLTPMVSNKEGFGVRNNLIPIEFLLPLGYKKNGNIQEDAYLLPFFL